MGLLALKNGLNDYFIDGENGLFTKSVLGSLGDNDWPAIIKQLEEWQRRGLLKILKNPEQATNDEFCIEMLDLIDMKSPIPGWPPKNA